VLEEIAQAIDGIVVIRESQFHESQSTYQMPTRPAIPPYQTFRLVTDVEGIPAGTLVQEPSLLPGSLAGAIASGQALILRAERVQQSLQDAANAQRRIQRAQAERLDRVAQHQMQEERARLMAAGVIVSATGDMTRL